MLGLQLAIFLMCFSRSNGEILHKNVTDFVNDLNANMSLALSKHIGQLLHFQDMQSLYQHYPPAIPIHLQSGHLLGKIAGNIGKRLVKGIDILQRNKDFIEMSYNLKLEIKQKAETCCAGKTSISEGMNGLLKDSVDRPCYKDPKRGRLIPYRDAMNLFKQNTKDDNYNIFVQQYFGDSDGSYLQYPSPSDNISCYETTRKSHIFSHWYVLTASPKKKNVIILIDASGSMAWNIGGLGHTDTPHRIDVAKEAAKTVIDTLSPTDHVGVLSFGDHTRSPSSCLGSHMGKASGHNKVILKDFIEKIVLQNNTYFKEAFTEAFKLLSATKQKFPTQFEDSENIILLLTDGIPTENPPHKKLLRAIADGQHAMNNSVHVFLYALGWEMFNGKNANLNIQTLMKLADQNNKLLNPPGSSPEVLQWQDFPDTPVGPPGYITFISDANGQHLNTILGRYYTHLPVVNRTTPTISLPYVKQAFGQVITLGLPVYSDGDDLVGVTALDVSLEGLLYDAFHFEGGKDRSYVFISGVGGTVIWHPWLRRPQYQKNRRMYHIRDLEPFLSDDAVYNISHGIKGWQATRATDSNDCLVTFFYTPISGFEDAFVVVLKKCENEEIESFINTSALGPNLKVTLQKMVYDKITHVDSDVCFRGGLPVLYNDAVTLFPSDINAGHTSIQNLSEIEEGMFDNITEFASQFGVFIGTAIDVFLTKQKDDRSDALWRYVGTENGMFQVYPGTVLSTRYDPRLDTWYKEAVTHINATMFLQKNNTTLTLARAFLRTRDRVAGVLAADFDTRQISAVFAHIIRPCIKKNINCFILNHKGYVVYEDSLVSTDQHVTQILPGVASALLQNGLLQAEWCMDLEKGQLVLSHKLKRQIYTSNTNSDCNNYWIRPINETNLFLLATSSSPKCTQSKPCSCTTECLPCPSVRQSGECQCPCACGGNLQDVCNLNVSIGYKTCPGRGANWKKLTRKIPVPPGVLNLTHCNQSCNSQLNSTSCSSVSGCSWCTTGLYKTSPLCTRQCVIDKLDIQYSSSCVDIALLQSNIAASLLLNVSIAFDSLLSRFRNLASHSPLVDHQGTVTITVYTLDDGQIEQSALRMLNTKSISVTCGVCNSTLTLYPKGAITKLGVTFQFNHVNFTSQLTSALTLRDFIQKKIRQFIYSNLQTSVADRLDNLWLFDDMLSFTLAVPLDITSDHLVDRLKSLTREMLYNHTTFDFMNTITSLKNVTITSGTMDNCGQPCNYTLDRVGCNIRDDCKWNILPDNRTSQCSEDTYLPERYEAVVYFPCMGLYSKLSPTDKKQVVTEVKLKVKKALDLYSNKSTFAFRYGQDDMTIGAKVEFTFQGTIQDPRISNSLQYLAQVMGGLYINIGRQKYSGYNEPRRKRHFTNLQVVLTVSTFDFDRLLLKSPLTAREEIENAVRSLVNRYFIPVIAQTLTDIQPYQTYLPFMVWQSSESDLDLEFYYDQIRRDVDAGRVLITLGGTHYSVDNLYYQGSFYQICPRPCHQNLTRSLCNSLPNCSWSHQLGQCTANALLPEKHEVTVLVPCDVLPHRSVQEKDVLIASFRQRVESALHMYPNISTRNVHSFGVGHVYPSSLVFTVQRSMQSPPLSRMVKDLEAWIANGELKINMGPNGTNITARGLGNFTELEVSLLYELIDFTDTSNLPLRQSSAKNITRLVSDVLPLDAISVLNFRFSRNYVIINAVKSATGTMSLKDIENVIRDLWKLGGFGVVKGNLKHIPKQILFQEKFYSNCTIDCSTRTDPDHCNKLKECVWSTERNVSFCMTDQMLPDRYQIDLFAPCMDLNLLSVAEVNDMERLLLGNFTAILGSPKSNVIRNVTITQKGVRVSLQASVQMPYLDTYIAILSNYTDYRTGYRFGVTSRKPLSFRDPFDYTNVLIKLTFNSIDFEILKIKYTYDDLTAKVVQSLNNVLLGVLVQSLEIVSIYREVVEFTLRKDGNSKVNMDKEIRLLSSTIEKGGLVLNIPFVRPVVASNMFVTGSFKELCPDKYPVITTTTVNVPITVSAANITPSQPITMTLPLLRPSVILIYNDSEIDRSRLKNHMDSYGLSTCLVEVHRCPACLTAFSRNTCRFDYSNVVITTTPSPVVTTPDQPHVVPVVEDDYRIGPVAATTMAVGGIFVLALLMWAVQSLHKAMKEKENKSESKPDSQTGRGIEELPVDY